MKHVILVLSIILFVSLPFLHPSVIEDASFNDYNYLRNLRRSDNRIDNEYTQKKLYDTTFTDQGKISNSTGTGSVSPIYNTITPVKTNIQTINSTGSTGLNDPSPNQTNSNQTNQTNQTNINLLSYLLLLLIIVVIIILYMKYKMN